VREQIRALRRLGRADLRRAPGRPSQPLERHRAQLVLVRIPGGGAVGVEHVRRDQLGHLLAVVRERAAQVIGCRQVARPALAPREHLVGDRAQQRLGERVLAAVGRQRVGAHGKDLLANERGQRFLQLLLAESAERSRRAAREAAAEHRHRLHELALVGSEGIEAGGEQGAERGGHVEVAELAGGLELSVA
jgi:hypothetical protein